MIITLSHLYKNILTYFRLSINNLKQIIIYCFWVINMYKRIRDLREDKDLTQKEVSKALNCSQQVYSNYELGQRDIPTDILIKLSKFYNVSTDYILGISDTPEITK